ncbi:hypothetical protein M0R45_018464 [Rubus argutus]|uniref:Uncharacterized protein n=1 Tax=Rubus argutus TaxID=59490 RepID=A0AAW1X494_RUBAR
MTRIPGSVKSTVIEGSKIVLFGGWLDDDDDLGDVCGFETRRDPTNFCWSYTRPLPSVAQFTYAVAGTNILIWSINHPGVGVSRFDVSHPEKGWTQLNSDLGDCIPSLGRAQILFLKLHPDRVRDRGFLMFSLTAYHGKPNLQVFIVSHDCDSLKPIDSVPLPKMALDSGASESHFFHIQGQKFGLALFRPKWLYGANCIEKVRVAVITYEYQVITTHDDHYDAPAMLYNWLVSMCCNYLASYCKYFCLYITIFSLAYICHLHPKSIAIDHLLRSSRTILNMKLPEQPTYPLKGGSKRQCIAW